MDQSQISMVDDSICVSLQQGTRRKLLDDFETPLKEKRQRTEGDGSATGKDHMRVYLRVRPFTSKEEDENQNQVGSLLNIYLTEIFVYFNLHEQ